MKALLVALPFNTLACGMSIIVICIGCRIEQTTRPSDVRVEVTGPTEQAGVQSGGGNVGGTTPVPLPDGIVLVFEPREIEGPPGTNATVKVIAVTTNGVEVPSFDVESAKSSDPTIASVSDIDGRFVTYRLNSFGSTAAIIKAAGTERAITIWVK